MSALNQEIRELDRSPRAVRGFAWLVGSVALSLGLLLSWRHRAAGPWFAGAGAALISLGVFAPRVLRPLHWVWMSVALVLGHVMTTVFLTGLFFLVFTPVGWMARRCGKDFLRQRSNPAATTWWIPREGRPPDAGTGYDRQG